MYKIPYFPCFYLFIYLFFGFISVSVSTCSTEMACEQIYFRRMCRKETVARDNDGSDESSARPHRRYNIQRVLEITHRVVSQQVTSVKERPLIVVG